MSIKSEITRLQQAKSGIASAIERKGIAVPSDTRLDEMESFIDDIETGVDTSDATASANEILQGETAYVNGEKIIGTIETFDGSYECSGESTGGSGEDVTEEVSAYTEKLVTLETAIAALETELEGKASGGSDNVSYFTVINNLSYDFVVNGYYCTTDTPTLIPYSEEIEYMAIVIDGQVPDYSIKVHWTELMEDENGESFEEAFSATVSCTYNADFNFTVGILHCYIPIIVDHTVTFEHVEV